MSNVLEFPDLTDLKDCTYVDFGDFVGLSFRDDSLRIQPISHDKFLISTELGCFTKSRKELAEFLHVASCLVDSEDRYKPNHDLIGVNYS